MFSFTARPVEPLNISLFSGTPCTINKVFPTWSYINVLPCPACKEAPANLGGAKASCIEQGGFHISTDPIKAPSRRLVGIGALAQEQERRVPGFAIAGEPQWRHLGKGEERLTHLFDGSTI